MTPDRKKPTVGFWITVALVAVQMGYPLAYGPWIGYGDDAPRRIQNAVNAGFRPLDSVLRRGLAPAVYGRYLEYWIGVAEARARETERRHSRLWQIN